MMTKLSRRDFLKSTVALPAWSILPSWPTLPLPLQHDLFAIDFGWQCYDPFFENDLAFYQSGGASVFGGPELFEDYFDDDQINDCIKNGSFGYSCKTSFLVRGFMRSGKSGLPSQNQDLACDDLRSRNPLSTFYCPVCETGWWLGHVAEGFEDTFFFVSGDNFNDTDAPLISKVVAPPPAGTIVVRDDGDEWFRKGPPSPPGYPPQEALLKDEQAWAVAYDKWEEACERRDREYLNAWADTNRLLPNQANFGI